MKKTLIALAVTAFAASATAKVDLVNQDGTSVSIDGRVKIVAHKETTKEKNSKSVGHSSLSNDGSRIGLSVNHNISDDFYALGRLEVRFHKDATNTANFGNAYAHRAYVGLGSKEYGQVTFGRQLLIGDDIGRIGLDNYYGVGSAYGAIGGWSILNEAADSGVRYEYKGIQGLTLGADYSFATENDTGSARKTGYGAGAIYEFEAGAGTASVSLGYAHNDFEVSKPTLTAGTYKLKADGKTFEKDDFGGYIPDNTAAGKHVTLNAGNPFKDQDGVFGGFNYVVNGVKVGLDGGYSVRKGDNVKEKLHYVRTGARYDIPNTKTGVYGNYSYTLVTKGTGADRAKDRAHQFMLGADYSFHKNVKVFLEGKLAKARFDDQTKQKQTDKGIATGLVVFW